MTRFLILAILWAGLAASCTGPGQGDTDAPAGAESGLERAFLGGIRQLVIRDGY